MALLFNANLLAVLYHLKVPITRIAPKNVLFPASLLTYFHIIRDLDRDLIGSKLISPPLNKPPRKLQLMHGSSTLAGYSAECRSKTRYFHWKTIKGRLYQRGRASTSNYAGQCPTWMFSWLLPSYWSQSHRTSHSVYSVATVSYTHLTLPTSDLV